MVQPRETSRPPLRSVKESYIGATGAAYSARAAGRLTGADRPGAADLTLSTAQPPEFLKLVTLEVA